MEALPKENAPNRVSQTTLDHYGQIIQRQPLQGSIEERISSQLVAFIVGPSVPFSTVENVEFRDLLRLLEPR